MAAGKRGDDIGLPVGGGLKVAQVVVEHASGDVVLMLLRWAGGVEPTGALAQRLGVLLGVVGDAGEEGGVTHRGADNDGVEVSRMGVAGEVHQLRGVPRRSEFGRNPLGDPPGVAVRGGVRDQNPCYGPLSMRRSPGGWLGAGVPYPVGIDRQGRGRSW